MFWFFGFFGFGGFFVTFLIIWIIISIISSHPDENTKIEKLEDDGSKIAKLEEENSKLKFQVSLFEKIYGHDEKIEAHVMNERSRQSREIKPDIDSFTSVAPKKGGDKPRFCVECGKSLPESAQFCPNCGTKTRNE